MSARTRKILVLSLIAALAIFSGCGGGGSSTSDSSSSESGIPPVASLPARTLSWEAPTSYVDTTSMNPVTDLDRFEIYLNETGTFTTNDVPLAELSAVDPQTSTLATSFNLANLSPEVTVGPKYYVSLRAVAITGLKSDFSPPVSFTF
jgi:hypothetical protein